MQRVVVFCAGSYFKQYYARILQQYEIVALTDNDSTKWHNYYEGVLCLPPQNALSKVYDICFVASKRLEIIEAVKKQLKNEGIVKEVRSIVDMVSLHKFENIWENCEWRDENNNRVVLEGGNFIRLINVRINGSNNRIYIGKNVQIEGNISIDIQGNGCNLEIGDGTYIAGASFFLGEGGSIQIGNGCMISYEVIFMQAESHPIFNLDGKRINLPGDIEIGERVWIGQRASLLGGFIIGEESIVGLGTISSSVFGKNCCIAGSPARIVREGVMWTRDALGIHEIMDINDSKMWK